MAALQKALQFNQFDDRAMNLLGMVYLQEGEGDEIALSLCRKSVELEPSNLVYRVNLAEVQLRCLMVREARGNLYRCLRSRRYKAQAQFLLGKSYRQEGKSAKAEEWLQKVLAEVHGQPELREKALGCLKGMI
jgi:cytochrome c-type biogenesis protein CcmH/NrfG